VTGTADEVAMAYALIANAAEMDEDLRLAMEVNLSCPNIAGSPPPAYEREGLREYLEAINDSKMTYRGRMDEESVPRVGVKLPPYTHSGQFSMVVEEIAKVNGGGGGGGVDFVTSTNTLGGCLVLDDSGGRALNSETGAGIGGMAGQALHPLSLGNVSTLRKMLDAKKETRDVVVIGVGGVEDKDGFERMRGVGAGAVGCATALGREGVNVFAKISGVKPQEGKVPRVVVEKPRREITDTYR
jgi:dihydroorotate dehydrogenase (fumarate)